MASLSLSSGVGVVYWTISGLTADNYSDLGVATSPANGTKTRPSGVLDYIGAFSTPPTYQDGSFSHSAGMYTFYGFAETLDGTYYPAGSGTITIPSASFSWDVPKTSGSHTITASEWNNLISFIAGKVGSFTVTYAVAGNSVSAAMYNQLINAMGAGSSYLVSAHQAITATKLNLLVTLANSL